MNRRLPTTRFKRTILAVALLACSAGYAAEPLPVPVAEPARPDDLIRHIQVQAAAGKLVADGRTQIQFRVTAHNQAGEPVQAGSVAVQVSDGVLLDAEGRAKREPIQLQLQGGDGVFTLIAPTQAGTVTVVVKSGATLATGRLDFAAEPRDMIAVGTLDQIFSQRHLQSGSIAPVNANDSFDRELTSWSRSLGSDVGFDGRLAFFLKGKISGEAVLTAAYDSDKDTRLKLAQVVDPNALYPVYGDSSMVSMEAQSSDRLFVRLDKDKNFLLYGDFSVVGTAEVSASALASNAKPPASVLGRYNRSATGIRGHYEEGPLMADGFLTSDSLKQVVEELAANGTSGPFAVRNTNAVLNSERVELVVRDKNQRGLIRSVSTLVRFVDYTFEPFSGRILLTTPLASLTPSGDAQSLRISYEVDQGGPTFTTYALNGSALLQPGLRVGGSYVQDDNPLSPYRLSSVNAEWHPSAHVRVTVEGAQTQSTQYQANGQTFATPSGQAGEVGQSYLGEAWRIDWGYDDSISNAHLWWIGADSHFNNVSSGLAAGRQESGIRAATMVDEQSTAYVEYTATEDAGSAGQRQSSKAGMTIKVSPAVQLDVSLRAVHDNLQLPPEALIPTVGMASGGFSGAGTANALVDPLTGATLTSLAAMGSLGQAAGTAGKPLDATTARLGAVLQASPELQLDAAVEGSIDGSNDYRLGAGALYTLSPTDHLFARAETQSGLASPNSVNRADRSNAFSAGLVHGYSDETSLFSEYKLLDASSGSAPSNMDQMLANGLQNRHRVEEGVLLTTTAEYLTVMSGSQREAIALSGGLDFTSSKLWRAATKLEYRRLLDDRALAGDQSQDQWLATLSLARKLDDDWTLLFKNYYLLQDNHADAAGAPLGDVRQERFIAGLAWRPSSDNRFNLLARYEYKSMDDGSRLLGDRYEAHIGSLSLDYRPQSHWWSTTRVAAKSSSDYTATSPDQTFNALLWSARTSYDLTERVDVGLMMSTLMQGESANKSALGLEVGYLVAKNIWLSAGYNWSGFYDRDLSGSDYTLQGPYLRLRAKFDETLFAH